MSSVKILVLLLFSLGDPSQSVPLPFPPPGRIEQGVFPSLGGQLVPHAIPDIPPCRLPTVMSPTSGRRGLQEACCWQRMMTVRMWACC